MLSLSSLVLAAAFQIGPFYEQKGEDFALRPWWSVEGQTTDVVWPLFTRHEDWWRCLLLLHGSTTEDGGQVDLLPLCWYGRARNVREEVEDYWGLFPLYGHHPHFLFVYDLDFVLWPLWTSYRMPRPSEGRWLETKSVLWPIVHWRDDGSWGVWPLYTRNHQRESLHQAVLWPLFTWASYERDRDSAGAGSSWMVWPLFGKVTRERESQWLWLPPLFSYAEAWSAGRGTVRSAPDIRLRCPWPFFEYESTVRRDRISVWPLYEKSTLKTYGQGEDSVSVTRFGWKLIELYDDETRVFPFWVSRKDDTYFRLWPFWESSVGEDGVRRGRFLSLLPIRHAPQIDRNWAKFWTFYERAETKDTVTHSLFWGIIRWRTARD